MKLLLSFILLLVGCSDPNESESGKEELLNPTSVSAEYVGKYQNTLNSYWSVKVTLSADRNKYSQIKLVIGVDYKEYFINQGDNGKYSTLVVGLTRPTVACYGVRK
ncbi:MAG: hypothetical protein Q8L88_02145 [Bacteroidota bacterium]|nr:hypothetical protein [Bacteroidota bacterium]